jgi:N-methylhydantoinase B
MMRSGGGGGFGRATERDPQLVARDVREGYVSRQVALDSYRVVIDGDGTVDAGATRALRARTDIAPTAVAVVADDTGPQLDMTPG